MIYLHKDMGSYKLQGARESVNLDKIVLSPHVTDTDGRAMHRGSLSISKFSSTSRASFEGCWYLISPLSYNGVQPQSRTCAQRFWLEFSFPRSDRSC